MTIGVLGGGQLGLMLAEAAGSIGLEVRCLDPNPEACAARAAELSVGGFDDPDALDRFADGLELATYEFERVPVAAVERLAGRMPVRPGAESLRVAQDRLLEKRRLRETGFETAAFEAVGSAEELASALEAIGRPAILKTRTGGYDGKGQVRVREQPPAEAWAELGGAPAILESLVPFERELSLVCVRSAGGDVAFYPLVENHHTDGILLVTRAPALDVPPALEVAAQHHARELLESLGHIGVLTIELFQIGTRLIANEIAPRVHNSGHWTIEGAATSQFENHLRAIAGTELGPTSPLAPAAMVNMLGSIPDAVRALDLPGLVLHDYGKAPRPGRKVGHATVIDEDADQLQRSVEAVLGAIGAGADQNTAR